jgi:hypothetical protein
MEFEVESISGQMRCTSGFNPPNTVGTVFNTVGVKRAYYTSFSSDTQFEFCRNNSGAVVSCIIKNISFRPLGTCNPMQLINTTSDRWQQVPCRV